MLLTTFPYEKVVGRKISVPKMVLDGPPEDNGILLQTVFMKPPDATNLLKTATNDFSERVLKKKLVLPHLAHESQKFNNHTSALANVIK